MTKERRSPVRREFQDGDCYSVDRLEGGVLQVRHFPTWRAGERPCCQMRVRVTAADKPDPDTRPREQIEADPTGEIAALHRSYLAMERRHAQKTVQASA